MTVKVRTTYLVTRRRRLFTAVGSDRGALLFAMAVILTAALACLAGGSCTGWAQEDTTSPSVDFRADPLEAQVQEEEGPTKEVVVTNTDGQDDGLEFSAEVEGAEDLLRSADSSALSFLDDPLVLKVSQEDVENEVKKDVYLYVRNGSNLTTKLDFSTELRDKNSDIQEVAFDQQGSTSAAPRSVTAVHLEMESGQLDNLGLPLKGFLVVSGTEESPSGKTVEVASGALQLTITSYEPRKAWFAGEYSIDPRDPVLLLPFVVSAILVGETYRRFRKKEPKGKDYCPLRGGTMKALGTGLGFDPTKSWATLLTAVATLVTSVTGATVLPETRVTFTKNSVAVLAISFGALLLISPMIYNGFRQSITDEHSPENEEADSSQAEAPALGEESELRGYVFTLLVTSAGILGALLGQLSLAILLVNEIENIDVTGLNRGVLWTLLGLAVIYACLYVCRSVWSTLQREVRWGENTQQRIDKLNEQKRKLSQLRSRITDEDPQLAEIRGKTIDLEVREINKKIRESERRLGFGTGRGELKML